MAFRRPRILVCLLTVVVAWGVMTSSATASTPAAEPAPPSEAPVDIVLRATGRGLPPKRATGAQARLMAERAATLVALRNLAAKLGRARLDPKTGVVEVEAFLAGYRLAERTYNPDGSVEATVEISLDRIYGNVHRMLQEQLDEARKRRAEAQQELAELRRQRDEMKRAHEAGQEKIAVLTAVRADAEQRLAVEKAQSAARQAQHEATIKDLEAQRDALRQEVADLRAELKRLRGH